MVADLLEAHQEREHEPAALHAVDLLELFFERVDGLAVECGLRTRELAERLDLGLVRQVGDDALVGLQASENVGPHQLTQRRIGIACLVHRGSRAGVCLLRGQPLGELAELLGRAEQPRIEEVEDRPQIAEPVLDRRAGQRDARLRVDLLDGSRLLGPWVLDRLRLVENGEPPGNSRQRRRSLQRAIAGDHQIDVGEPAGIERLDFVRRHVGRVCNQRAQIRRETSNLGRPVAEQRGRGDKQARRVAARHMGCAPRCRIGVLSLQHQKQ